MEANPYEAPTQALEPTAGAVTLPPGFGEQRTLLLVLTLLLGGQITIDALNALSAIALVPLSSQGLALELQDLLVRGSDLAVKVNQGFYLFTWVPFLMFLHRANRNAQLLSGNRVPYTPAAMVWWFFIPIANWWKPYQAVRAVWDASEPPGETLARQRVNSPVALWWSCYLASIAGNVVFNALTAGLSDETASVALHNALVAASAALSGAASAVALWLLRSLAERQIAAASALVSHPSRLEEIR